MAIAKTQHRLADYLTDNQVELIHVSDVLKHFVINLKRGERKACGGAFHPEVSFYVVEGEGPFLSATRPMRSRRAICSFARKASPMPSPPRATSFPFLCPCR
nr:hypothetical protein [Calditerricola satsumensis]